MSALTAIDSLIDPDEAALQRARPNVERTDLGLAGRALDGQATRCMRL